MTRRFKYPFPQVPPLIKAASPCCSLATMLCVQRPTLRAQGNQSIRLLSSEYLQYGILTVLMSPSGLGTFSEADCVQVPVYQPPHLQAEGYNHRVLVSTELRPEGWHSFCWGRSRVLLKTRAPALPPLLGVPELLLYQPVKCQHWWGPEVFEDRSGLAYLIRHSLFWRGYFTVQSLFWWRLHAAWRTPSPPLTCSPGAAHCRTDAPTGRRSYLLQQFVTGQTSLIWRTKVPNFPKSETF